MRRPAVMAGVEMSLQERIRASYAPLTSAQRSSAGGQASDAALGRLYGQVGKLLLAAKLNDHDDAVHFPRTAQR